MNSPDLDEFLRAIDYRGVTYRCARVALFLIALPVLYETWMWWQGTTPFLFVYAVLFWSLGTLVLHRLGLPYEGTGARRRPAWLWEVEILLTLLYLCGLVIGLWQASWLYRYR